MADSCGAGGLPRRRGAALGAGLARRLVFALFERIGYGSLTVSDRWGVRTFGPGGGTGPDASIEVVDPRLYLKVITAGSLGAAEGYMDGWWSSSDLVTVARLFTGNRAVLHRMDFDWGRVTAPFHGFVHMLRRNTPRGSRRNVEAHYDLSNEFFALFLDRTMAYSCAVFEEEESTLAQASAAKFERICRKLDLHPGDRVLEIGGGWGGFALHAARTRGCRVTTITISRRQYDYTLRRLAEEGLDNRVEVLLRDYRHVRGRYSKLVSIEMIEAVGHHYLDTFFRCCSDLLDADGAMALQTITVPDWHFHRHARSVNFIKKYIFPGGCLPSCAAIAGSVSRATDLRIVHLEDITPHYARTLRIWRERFLGRLDAVRSLGMSERFIRMWDFYLASCEGSFSERHTGNVQMVFAKPGSPLSPLPRAC